MYSWGTPGVTPGVPQDTPGYPWDTLQCLRDTHKVGPGVLRGCRGCQRVLRFHSSPNKLLESLLHGRGGETSDVAFDYNLSYAFFKKRRLHEAVQSDPFICDRSFEWCRSVTRKSVQELMLCCPEDVTRTKHCVQEPRGTSQGSMRYPEVPRSTWACFACAVPWGSPAHPCILRSTLKWPRVP